MCLDAGQVRVGTVDGADNGPLLCLIAAEHVSLFAAAVSGSDQRIGPVKQTFETVLLSTMRTLLLRPNAALGSLVNDVQVPKTFNDVQAAN